MRLNEWKSSDLSDRMIDTFLDALRRSLAGADRGGRGIMPRQNILSHVFAVRRGRETA
jgi:hypothetical protein